MAYNIHPIFVHFPIAFLFTYSLVKVLPLKRWFPGVSWRHIEQTLLAVGVLGAFAALGTGENAERLYRAERQVIEVHSFFAGLATFIYGILLGGEILAFINKNILSKLQVNLSWLSGLMSFVESIVTNGVVSAALAILGLLAITLTGLLGGAIVYGTTADPIAKFVLQFLGTPGY